MTINNASKQAKDTVFGEMKKNKNHIAQVVADEFSLVEGIAHAIASITASWDPQRMHAGCIELKGLITRAGNIAASMHVDDLIDASDSERRAILERAIDDFLLVIQIRASGMSDETLGRLIGTAADLFGPFNDLSDRELKRRAGRLNPRHWGMAGTADIA